LLIKHSLSSVNLSIFKTKASPKLHKKFQKSKRQRKSFQPVLKK
jgi:hypothetical protein